MSFRISQIAIQPILLDEHDAPQTPEPAVFQGDANGSALEKAQQFLEELAMNLEKLDDAEAVQNGPAVVPSTS